MDKKNKTLKQKIKDKFDNNKLIAYSGLIISALIIILTLIEKVDKIVNIFNTSNDNSTEVVNDLIIDDLNDPEEPKKTTLLESPVQPNFPIKKEFINVKLLLPTRMKGASVIIDGQKVVPIKMTSTTIELRIQKKNSPYNISIVKEGFPTCAIEQSIIDTHEILTPCLN